MLILQKITNLLIEALRYAIFYRNKESAKIICFTYDDEIKSLKKTSKNYIKRIPNLHQVIEGLTENNKKLKSSIKRYQYYISSKTDSMLHCFYIIFFELFFV